MLKLEKNQQTQDLKIKFQRRDRFLNRPLIFALTIAIAIHVVSWLIFTIAPLAFDFPDALIVPIIVEADPQPDKNRAYDQTTFTELEQRKIAKRSLIEPAKRKMSLPIITQKPIDQTLNIFENENLLISDNVMSQPFIDDTLSIPLNLPKVSIEIFGPLANKTLLFDGLKEREFLSNSSIDTLKQQRITFDVLMNHQEGRLIWFVNASTSSSSQKLSKEAETLLKNMRFSKSTEPGMTRGIVEIVWVKG